MRAPISKPPGSTAPGAASATLSPAEKLVAPQTTPRLPSLPSACPSSVAIRQYRIGFLNSASSSTDKTWAMTTPEMSWPTGSTDSTSSLIEVSTRAISAASTEDSIGAYSRSQDSGSFMVRSPSRRPG